MVTPAGLDSFVADAIHFTVQRYFRELLEDPTGPFTTAWATTSLQAPTSTGATTDTERGAMTAGACNGWDPVPDADDRGAWRASGRSVTTSFTAICAPCPRVIKTAVHPLHAHARPSYSPSAAFAPPVTAERSNKVPQSNEPVASVDTC